MAVSPLPTPVPQTSDPVNFNPRADALMTALPTFVTEVNALQVDVNAKQVLAATSATNAATSETNAATSAATAVSFANSAVNAPGTSATSTSSLSIGGGSKSFTLAQTGKLFSLGQWLMVTSTASPSNWMTGYITAFDSATGITTITVGMLLGTGTFSSWTVSLSAPISIPAKPYMKVKDQKTSGTNGGTAVINDITQIRDLNTVETNTIAGASLASNTITLPAGTYGYSARAPMVGNNLHKAFLYNTTDGTYVGNGCNSSGAGGTAISTVTGQFTITSSKNFVIRYWSSTGVASGTIGLGQAATGSGQPEIYTEVEIWQVGV